MTDGNGNPHPADDDIASNDDLPPDVVLNIAHAPEPPQKPTGSVGAMLELTDAVRDLIEEIAALREALPTRGSSVVWHLSPKATPDYPR